MLVPLTNSFDEKKREVVGLTIVGMRARLMETFKKP